MLYSEDLLACEEWHDSEYCHFCTIFIPYLKSELIADSLLRELKEYTIEERFHASKKRAVKKKKNDAGAMYAIAKVG